MDEAVAIDREWSYAEDAVEDCLTVEISDSLWDAVVIPTMVNTPCFLRVLDLLRQEEIR